MASPDPAITEWVPLWNPTFVGPQGPPGPPGPVGGAVGEAKYWLVETFDGLPNAKAVGPSSGYVKSAVGVPAVVPTIPLTDTTGILPDNRLTSNVALKNIDNFFSVPQSIPSFSTIRGGYGTLLLVDTLAPVDQKVWRIINYQDGLLRFEKLTDDITVAMGTIIFNQAGAISASSFHGSGVGLTNLNASNLATGLAAPARLGNGTANNTTFLRGDSTWAIPVATDPFPSGTIVLSAGVPCAIGWTRVTVYDGRFIRVGPGGLGGSNTHSHGVGSYFTGAGTYGSTTNGNHSHSLSGSGSGSTGNSQGGQSGADAGGSFTASAVNHFHDFSVNINGNTDTLGDHSHTVTIPAVGLSGSSDAQSNVPLYLDLWLCQKN